MRLIVQNILRDFENASIFISYFLYNGYQLTTIHGYSDDDIPYQKSK